MSRGRTWPEDGHRGAIFAKTTVVAAYCGMLLLTPAQASAGCMSHAEARQMFRTSYLYWHGKDHCWDASPVASRRASIAHYARHHETREPPVAPPVIRTTAPSKEPVTPSASVSPTNSRQARLETPLPDLRKWSDTMAMADTIETTPWINRWPDRPIIPPSRSAFVEAAADSALVTPRGIMAVIMTLGLGVAVFEILFGGRRKRMPHRA